MFDLDGATIRYTLDGSMPDEQSPLYWEPFRIHASCNLTAIAYHPEFRASEPLRATFVRTYAAYEPESATLAMPPNAQYPGEAKILYDHGKGNAEINSGRWLGFSGQNLDYSFSLKKAQRARSLIVSTLSSPGAWIFPPRRVQVWASRHPRRGFRPVGELVLPKLANGSGGLEEQLITLPFSTPRRARYWRVVVENYGSLPDWHSGKGQPAWLFVDEIILQP